MLAEDGLARLDRHPAAVYLMGLAAGSRPTMRGALRTIANLASPGSDEVSLPWTALDFAHVAAVRSKLEEAFAPATANRMLAALRGVLRAAFKLGLISAEHLARVCAIEPVRGARVAKGRALPSGELRTLFEACDLGTPAGARNAALLGLLYGCGLRRAEVVGLDAGDYDPASGRLLVHGKGNQQREIFAPDGTKLAVDAWLAIRGDAPGPLLHPIDKGGAVEPRRMTAGAVAKFVTHLAKKTGVRAFSPHDMRRTFIGDMLDAGADIATVQAMAGHANPATTSRYDRRGARAKAKAAGLLHVPVSPRSATDQ